MTTTSNDDDPRVTLGELIRRSRIHVHHQTQSQLAELVNLSQPSVCRWESDEARPDWLLFTFLARYCRVALETFIRLASKPPRR